MRPLITESLSARHVRTEFDCGREPLNAYLRQYARQDRDRSMASIYVHCPQGSDLIAAYYTLSAYAALRSDLPAEAVRRLGRHALIPAILLGRLAVDRRFQGRRLGDAMLFDALCRATEAASLVAAAVVVVDAKDDAALFYQRYGFEPFADEVGRLFLPIATAAALVA